jgi:hypothetical protein
VLAEVYNDSVFNAEMAVYKDQGVTERDDTQPVVPSAASWALNS